MPTRGDGDWRAGPGPAADSLSQQRPPGPVTARYFRRNQEASAGVRPTENEWPATPESRLPGPCRCTDYLRGLMDQHDELSRRRALRAGLGGLAGAAVSLPSGQASASSVSPTSDSSSPDSSSSVSSSANGAAAPSAPARTYEFTAGTNAFVSASPADGRLIAAVQGVLWSVPRAGGTATALTSADLEPARVSWSPDGSRVAVCAYQGAGSMCGRWRRTVPVYGS